MSAGGISAPAFKSEDDEVVEILTNAKLIAVVGATNRESMPVHGVMRFLQEQVTHSALYSAL